MTVLYIVSGIIGGFILLIVLIGLLSPRHTHVERSAEINTTEEKVYEQAINLKKFVDNWSPWTALDPNIEQTFTGPAEGTGSRYDWKGDRKKVGSGTMTITKAETNRYVTSHLNFHGRGESDVTIKIDPASEGKTKVTWMFDADNGYRPLARFFGRMMDKFLGKDFEKGMNNLKNYLENQ